jgi:hypothetical protein
MRIGTVAGAAALSSLISLPASDVTGQDGAAHRVQVHFRVIGTPVRAATSGIGSLLLVLEPGETARTTVHVTLSPAGGECESNVTFGGRPDPQPLLPVWVVEAVPRRVAMDDIEIAFSWQRWSTGRAEPDAAGRGEVALREDGHVLLDVLPLAAPWSDCFRNVGLELAASIPEDPAFQQARIAYDLWWVRQEQGHRTTRRLQLMGKQGEKVAFDYGEFRSPLPGPARPDGEAAVMKTSVLGSVRGRIQTDGTIELRLAAERSAGPVGGDWRASAHGQKLVRARPGETLQLDLPPPSRGGAGEPATSAALDAPRVFLVLTPTLVE